jgi:glycosyltransferase involved in cell wall biosynthesis
VRLTITGDDAGKTLPAAANVLRTGFVEDVRPVIARAAVSIAPIFTGGGTRLKILEAMALRTPVVSTTKGAEGLDIEHGRHLLIADTAEVFADAVLSLLRDAQFRQGLAERAYQLVTEKYDWAAVMPLFLNVVHDSVHTSQLSSH